jgi:transcription initiation factor IIE alpha subunit
MSDIEADDTKILQVFACKNLHEYYFANLGNIRPFLCPICKNMLKLIETSIVPSHSHPSRQDEKSLRSNAKIIPFPKQSSTENPEPAA